MQIAILCRSVRPGASGVFKGPPRAVGLFVLFVLFILVSTLCSVCAPLCSLALGSAFCSVPVNDDGSELQFLVNIVIYVAVILFVML